jgi:hypothetical protein
VLTPMTAAAQDQRILPDRVDLPVLVGSELMSVCEITVDPGQPQVFQQPQAQCVIVAPGHSLQDAYTRELRQAGWTMSGGAANTLSFERRTSRGCLQRLVFAGFRRPAVQVEGVVYLFALEPDGCGESQE